MCSVLSTSHELCFVTPWTVACQAPLSIRFSRQEYWSRLPFPPPADLTNFPLISLTVKNNFTFFNTCKFLLTYRPCRICCYLYYCYCTQTQTQTQTHTHTHTHSTNYNTVKSKYLKEAESGLKKLFDDYYIKPWKSGKSKNQFKLCLLLYQSHKITLLKVGKIQ